MGSARLDLKDAVLRELRARQTAPGDRLFESRLSRTLGVSRQPVRNALDELCRLGLVRREPQRGYILDKPLDADTPPEAACDDSKLDEYYHAIASDHLDGVLPSDISEQALLRRYRITPALLARVLARAATDGWATRKPGYGWTLSDILRRPEAYDELMRFRAMFEPAALRQIRPERHRITLIRLRKLQARLAEPCTQPLSQHELFRLGCEFHETLARLSGNSYVVDALRRLNRQRRLFIYRTLLPHPDYVVRHASEHVSILDLLLDGQVNAAAEAMYAHLSR